MTDETVIRRGDQLTDTRKFVDLLIVVGRRRRLITGYTVCFSLASLLLSFAIPPSYSATATIMPPQQQSSGLSAMLGQLGSLAAIAPGVPSLKNPNDLYVGMLQSRTIADNLINRFKLMERYKTATQVDCRKQLAAHTNFSAGKDGIISIRVDDKVPQFAANLSNAYVEELKELNRHLAVTDASKRRLFFEQQLRVAKDRLVEAEIGLVKTQEQTGVLQPAAQLQAEIGSAVQLRATIAGKEAQLAALRSFSTDRNPNVQELSQEIASLKTQLTRVETEHSNGGVAMLSKAEFPGASLEYVRQQREVKYNETLYEMIAKEFESARLDEAHDASLIQELDRAVPADKRTFPRRSIFVAAGFALGFVTGLIRVQLRSLRDHIKRNTQDERWQQLILAWKFGRT